MRTHGKWSCDDAIQKGSVPLTPLDDLGMYPNGSKPRVSRGTFPGTVYNSLFALVLTTLRFKEMSRGNLQGRDALLATEFIESELGKRAFEPPTYCLVS